MYFSILGRIRIRFFRRSRTPGSRILTHIEKKNRCISRFRIRFSRVSNSYLVILVGRNRNCYSVGFGYGFFSDRNPELVFNWLPYPDPGNLDTRIRNSKLLFRYPSDGERDPLPAPALPSSPPHFGQPGQQQRVSKFKVNCSYFFFLNKFSDKCQVSLFHEGCDKSKSIVKSNMKNWWPNKGYLS